MIVNRKNNSGFNRSEYMKDYWAKNREQMISAIKSGVNTPDAKANHTRHIADVNSNPERRAAHSRAISEGRKHLHWKKFDELKLLWEQNNRPGYSTFRKIAVKAGYLDTSYQAIVRSFNA